jgi:hypothetical protein
MGGGEGGGMIRKCYAKKRRGTTKMGNRLGALLTEIKKYLSLSR